MLVKTPTSANEDVGENTNIGNKHGLTVPGLTKHLTTTQYSSTDTGLSETQSDRPRSDQTLGSN